MSKTKTDRNNKIVELYDNPKDGKKYTFRSLAAIFQISEAAIRQIYWREKGKSIYEKKGI